MNLLVPCGQLEVTLLHITQLAEVRLEGMHRTGLSWWWPLYVQLVLLGSPLCALPSFVS